MASLGHNHDELMSVRSYAIDPKAISQAMLKTPIIEVYLKIVHLELLPHLLIRAKESIASHLLSTIFSQLFTEVTNRTITLYLQNTMHDAMKHISIA